jgi:hypothetical protein
VRDQSYLCSVVQFVRRAAAAEVSRPPQVQQRPASSNGHRTALVELELLKQLKDENDQIRERLFLFNLNG